MKESSPVNMELDLTSATQWGTDMVDRDRATVAQTDLCSSEKGASPSLAVHSAPNSRVKGDLGRRVCIKPPNPTFPKIRKWDARRRGQTQQQERLQGADHSV